jgi:hypothetical protein
MRAGITQPPAPPLPRFRRGFLFRQLLSLQPPTLRERCHRGGLARRLRHAKYAAAWNSPVHTSSARHRSGCGMHLLLRCRESRIEYRLARLRAGSGRGGPGCVAHGGTRPRKVLRKPPGGGASSTRCRKSRSFVRPTISRLRRVISPNPLPPRASQPGTNFTL